MIELEATSTRIALPYSVSNSVLRPSPSSTLRQCCSSRVSIVSFVAFVRGFHPMVMSGLYLLVVCRNVSLMSVVAGFFSLNCRCCTVKIFVIVSSLNYPVVFGFFLPVHVFPWVLRCSHEL